MTETKTMRADARRNRDKLLAAAGEVFADAGADASLEAVARRAGVGVGTLYRHFPNRDALVEAVYRNEVDQLAGRAGGAARRARARCRARALDGGLRRATR